MLLRDAGASTNVKFRSATYEVPMNGFEASNKIRLVTVTPKTTQELIHHAFHLTNFTKIVN